MAEFFYLSRQDSPFKSFNKESATAFGAIPLPRFTTHVLYVPETKSIVECDVWTPQSLSEAQMELGTIETLAGPHILSRTGLNFIGASINPFHILILDGWNSTPLNALIQEARNRKDYRELAKAICTFTQERSIELDKRRQEYDTLVNVLPGSQDKLADQLEDQNKFRLLQERCNMLNFFGLRVMLCKKSQTPKPA